ncbi:MAG: phosphoribosylformylglycinamidine cyclo-ligase, partial [Blautia sp.]|nr:phosphoribosylformylglycinamidine cyclo-ligase [Blautia sp.]
MDYKKAGVDIEAGYRSVELMKEHIARTMRPEVLGGIGGFSGAFSMNAFKDMEEPTLVSGTDGVGTKLKLAFLMDRHDTVGIDCVAMCVNDIACAGGEPLFFLDYIACGKNYPEKIASIVSGVAEGCRQSGAALIGGETAEMPGFYPEDEYDLAGFAVGIVDKKDMITGAELKVGDTLIGIASSGVHSNGFSLVRKVFEMTAESLGTYYDELGTTLGDALIRPTKIYVKALRSVKEAGVRVHACSHITGGGFYENVPRMLTENTHAVIRKDSYPV